MSKRRFDLVEVIWLDAADSTETWKTHIPGEHSAEEVHSCGYLLEKADGHIVMAMNIDSNGQCCTRGVIPTSLIKRITVVRKAQGGSNGSKEVKEGTSNASSPGG